MKKCNIKFLSCKQNQSFNNYPVFKVLQQNISAIKTTQYLDRFAIKTTQYLDRVAIKTTQYFDRLAIKTTQYNAKSKTVDFNVIVSGF